MKKKGPRSIPDFSRKAKGRPGTAAAPDPSMPAPPNPRDVVVKPKTISSKSGRRGS
jgi:hypothetical protein